MLQSLTRKPNRRFGADSAYWTAINSPKQGPDLNKTSDAIREVVAGGYYWGRKTFVANKFRRGQISCRKNLAGFLKTVRKILVGFFLEPIRKYIRTKRNGAEGAEDFWPDKFRVGKFGGFS